MKMLLTLEAAAYQVLLYTISGVLTQLIGLGANFTIAISLLCMLVSMVSMDMDPRSLYTKLPFSTLKQSVFVETLGFSIKVTMKTTFDILCCY